MIVLWSRGAPCFPWAAVDDFESYEEAERLLKFVSMPGEYTLQLVGTRPPPEAVVVHRVRAKCPAKKSRPLPYDGCALRQVSIPKRGRK